MLKFVLLTSTLLSPSFTPPAARMPCTLRPAPTRTCSLSVSSMIKPTAVPCGILYSILIPTRTITDPTNYVPRTSLRMHPPNGSTSAAIGATSSIRSTTKGNTASPASSITRTARSARGLRIWAARRFAVEGLPIRAVSRIGFDVTDVIT